MNRSTFFAALAAAFLFYVTGISNQNSLAQPEIGKPAPTFSFTDTNGKYHNLSDFKGKYVVLEWWNVDCPFVVKHYSSGNMQALQAEVTKDGGIWIVVCSSAPGKQGHVNAEQANELMKKANAKMTAIALDPQGTIGRMYGARVTPHMYIIDPRGNLIYNGAIDSIRSSDPNDIPKAENYVRKALSEAKAGKPVTTATSQPYGCTVKY